MRRASFIGLGLAAALLAGAFPAGAQTQPRVGEQPDAQARSRFTGFADFNGDGLFDLAVGAPGEDVGAAAAAGAVNVFYGTASGLPSANQSLVQGLPETGDRLGTDLVSGNFNGDSFTDLAVGAPGEDVGATVDAGAVNVFFGSSSGLQATSQVVLQDNPEAGDQFGAAVTAETFSNDAFLDLVVGAPGENVGATVDAGAVNVFLDTAGALPGRSSQTLLQDNIEPGDRFGAALVAEFFSNDLFPDLVVGAPGENVGGIVDAGAANVFYDTAGTLPGISSQTLLQDNIEPGDQFGAAMTAGLFNGNFFADLAVGAPGENVGATVDAGAVNIFNNNTTVLPSTSSQTLLQDNIEAGDRFGAALIAGFFDAFGFTDLVVGAPGEDVGTRVDAGAANNFRDTAGSLPNTPSQTLLQDNIEPGDQFGAAMTEGAFSNPLGIDDLVVGAPGENVGTRVDAGAANVFYHDPTTGGLPTTSNQTLLQGNIEAGDQFGAAFDA